MNKSELIEALAQDQGLSTKTAASIVSTILDTMIETLVGATISNCAVSEASR